MLRNRSGVSEIQASLIILVIVSSAGAILYNTTLEILNGYEERMNYEKEARTESVLERLSLASTYWSGYDDNLTITVYNYCEFDVKVAEIYINSKRVDTYHYGNESPILPGELREIGFLCPLSILSDSAYSIIIVTERGVPNEFSWYS
ncbi:hypothetical protein A3K69_05740 [Candidatus Bathyarchaeota archaeon RBG_16_57_9]|nr:MAG: hypothetical protein A3K69_05740 [Candidatus Bathyarchaeota archaeon RBG_16_57_9]